YLLLREPATNGDALYATTDGGRTWSRRSPQGEPGLTSGMAVDPLDPDNMWFWGGGGLFHSSNGGRSRALEDRLAPPVTHFDVHHVPGRPARLMGYQAETQDFMRSDDGGVTWYPEGTPLGTAISLTHAPATGEMVMSVHNAVYQFVEPSFWIEVTPSGVEEIDLFDLQTDATTRPSVFGNARTYIARYTGLNFEVRLPDVDVDPLPPIDPTGASLTPPKKSLEMGPGRSRRVPYRLTLPEHPTGLDVFFLVDTSDSMDPTINGLREGMNEIVEELAKSKIDVRFGVGSYKDYPIPGYGDPRAGDYPYRLDRDIGPANASFTEALETLTSSGGGDLPESQLTGVHQTATGSGDPGFVPAGEGASFRAGALPVIVHITDAAFHNSPAHPSPALDDVAATLEAKGIIHIGLGVWGKNGNVLALRDLTALSDASESNAPVAVDCNGDGEPDIEAGEPLVCDVRDETRAGVMNLAPAIIATVKAVSQEVPVELAAIGGADLVASVTPDRYPSIDTVEAAGLDFDVTFNCPRGDEKTTEQVTLQATVRGVPVATAEVDIVCNPILAPLKPKPEPPTALPPLVPPIPAPAQAFVAVPPAPPAPIPETIPGTQPSAQAQGAMAEQEQEQTQLAFVHAGPLQQAVMEEELAFSDYTQRGRRSVPPGALYGAAGVMALAYACLSVARSRAQAAVQRVRR
nr:VWA domain-containing protein [Actinomycetota bacterium]